jgi:hypothetical protein
MKQIGSYPVWTGSLPPLEGCPRYRQKLKDRKGGDPSEWPAGLRIREFPGARHTA